MPNKKTPKNILFPLTEDGETQWINKREYSSLRSQQLTRDLKFKISKDHVLAMLDAIQGGQLLDGENPEEIVKAFQAVEDDLKSSAEHTEEVEQEEVQSEKEMEGLELALVSAATKEMSQAEGMRIFHEKFDVGASMLYAKPKGEVADEEIAACWAFKMAQDDGNKFQVGDLTNLLLERGHENAVLQIATQLNRDYFTISKYARVAKNIPAEDRKPELPFTVHAEIGSAKLSPSPEKHQKTVQKLLGEAAKKKMTSGDAREAVRKIQGKAAPQQSPMAPNRRYLVLILGDLGNSYVTDEEPEVTEKLHVVDVKDLTFADKNGDATYWTPIPFQATKETKKD